MRAAAALALLLSLPGAAPAFPFGRDRAEKAEGILAAARAAFSAGDCAAVHARAEALLSEKPPAALREELYGYVGRCHEAAGAADKAIAVYTLALGLFPDNAAFASRLGSVYVAAGFHANAAPLFEKALAARPDDAEARLGLGRAYAAQGFLSRAKEHYSRAVILQDFKDAAVLREYARWMLRKRDWDEAAYIVSRGAAAEPAEPFWKLARARVWAGRADYARAAAALEGPPASRELRLERAVYLLLGGEKTAALAAAEKELAANPADRTAALIKGLSLFSGGDRAAASRYFGAAACGKDLAAKLAGAFRKGAVEPACKN